MLQNEVERVQRLFDRMLLTRNFHVLPASQDLSSSLSIMNALRQGEIVVFNGDRAIGDTTSAEVHFFGRPADFPTGPYLMAAMTGAPVIQTFAMREGVDRYRFFCHAAGHVPQASRAERKQVLAECAAEFAGRLEAALKEYPFQWYNFYPFWKEAATEPEASPTGGAG
ncbi:MAG: lysophospholipid acyltransferase family protein [Verrucomicrobia bacterium]|nr:lysophospholipid acyltransferase family protein [Verrucomicrobiota bacterium]